jgi:hypothetical protein
MLLKSLTLCLTTFLILIPTTLADNPENPEWMVGWWLVNPNCQGDPDVVSTGWFTTAITDPQTTECFNAPSPPQSFVLGYPGTTALNVRVCSDQNCKYCSPIPPNTCWFYGIDPGPTYYQIFMT